MTTDDKVQKIQKLIETHGEEAAVAMQQVEDAEKHRAYEQWFRSDILGRKSNFRDME